VSIWVVSFLDYDLGYDEAGKRVEPVDDPFKIKSVTYVSGMDHGPDAL